MSNILELEKLESTTEMQVDPSEKMLQEELKRIKVNSGEALDVIVGIDCGSTQSRGILVPAEDLETKEMNDWFLYDINIPAISMSVREENKLTRISHKLIDNLNSRIQLKAGMMEHLVRGPLCNQLNTNHHELLASMKKTSSLALRLNIIDTIGYALIRKACHVDATYEMPGSINVALSLALPPDELHKTQIDKLKSDLSYVVWTIPYMTNKAIEIRVTEIRCYSEPEAQVRAYYGLAGKAFPSTVLMIEAGGRNSSASIRKSGAATNTKATLDMSGSILLSRISTAYMEKYNTSRIDDEWLIYALRTGLMKSGNSFINIQDIIKQQMDIVAEELFYQLDRHVMSRGSYISYETIDAVVLGGRFFALGADGYTPAMKLTEEINKRSEKTEIIRLDENFIPKGLLISFIVDRQLEEETVDMDAQIIMNTSDIEKDDLLAVGM